MVTRPLASAAILTAIAVVSTGCVSFSTEKREDRYKDGFSADIVQEPLSALQNTAAIPEEKTTPNAPTAVITKRNNGRLVVKWQPPSTGARGGTKYKIRITKPYKIRKYEEWSQASKKRRAVFRATPFARFKVQVRAINSIGPGTIATEAAGKVNVKYKKHKKVKKIKGAKRGKPNRRR